MRTLPLLLMLIVGIAVGVWIGRMSGDNPALAGAPAAESRDQPVVTFDTTQPPQPATPAAQSGVTPFPPPPVAQDAAPYVPPPPMRTEDPPAEGAGFVQPIDVGPVFGAQFDTVAREGHRDAMLEAHRALEREPRDDSWAYPMEAEIENSLIPDTSMGNFRREHVECRATKCEIRLSAQGSSQVEALRQWSSDVQRLPWATNLALSSASTIATDDRMDTLMIVEKPPAPGQPE